MRFIVDESDIHSNAARSVCVTFCHLFLPQSTCQFLSIIANANQTKRSFIDVSSISIDSFFPHCMCVCSSRVFFSQSPSTSVTYELIMHTMLPCVWHLKYFKISFCAKLPSFLIQSNITCEQSSSSTLDDVVRYMFVVRSGAQFNVIKFLYGRCMVMRDGYCSF